jgi:hypothetical protein
MLTVVVRLPQETPLYFIEDETVYVVGAMTGALTPATCFMRPLFIPASVTISKTPTGKAGSISHISLPLNVLGSRKCGTLCRSYVFLIRFQMGVHGKCNTYRLFVA